jgi:membrane protease YdiL (CAAX protease family)
MILYIAIYVLFFSLLWFSKEKRANRLFDNHGITVNPLLLILFHLAGILILGFAPLLSGHEFSYLPEQKTTILMIGATVLLTCLCILVSYQLAQKKIKQLREGGLIVISVSKLVLIIYFLVRVLFICFYEIWFRGMLLNYGISNFGIVTGIVLNVALYSLLHIVNGKEELLSCIPFGILLCYVSLWQGSVIPAIAIHLALTITYELSFIKKVKTIQPVVI